MPPIPTALISKIIIHPGDLVSAIDLNITFSGSISVEVTANATNASPTWQSVSIISGVISSITFTIPGNYLQYRIIGLPGAIITSINITTPESVSATEVTGSIGILSSGAITFVQDIRIYTEV